MATKASEPVGVIVARFQVPKLHQGHYNLINHVRTLHKDVVIVLGVHGGVRTRRNQLTFHEREIMIRQSVRRKLTILPLMDHPFSNDIWSQNLDALIAENFPNREAVIYGSRDGITDPDKKEKIYTGSYKKVYVAPLVEVSGTQIRKALTFPHTVAGRTALFYDIEQRPFGFMYSTSDLGVIDRAKDSVLLIGKNIHSGKLSFVGGHAEKTDENGQTVVIREGSEEVKNIVFGAPTFIGTKSIDDPRYTGTPDGVMTSFYRAPYISGTPVHASDADSTHWINRNNLLDVLVPWHKPLGEMLLNRWNDIG